MNRDPRACGGSTQADSGSARTVVCAVHDRPGRDQIALGDVGLQARRARAAAFCCQRGAGGGPRRAEDRERDHRACALDHQPGRGRSRRGAVAGWPGASQGRRPETAQRARPDAGLRSAAARRARDDGRSDASLEMGVEEPCQAGRGARGGRPRGVGQHRRQAAQREARVLASGQSQDARRREPPRSRRAEGTLPA